MPFQELPSDVLEMLTKYAASPRLVAHLTIVHDVAITLMKQIDACWPLLDYDRDRVLIGAATHDVGKTVYPNELTGPGSQHEEIGLQLLLDSGFPETHARFARTHGQWGQEALVQLEDTLVAFADTIWKGKRNESLEQEIAQQIAKQGQEETWEVFMKLDDIACELAKDAHDRILWQGKYPL
ncbi:HD domain-containing protein [Dictyobacter formicarum]|uniref:Phosphohydrolase n=1 Tax=Dictyobacter formicarum TaxID=2778368 RepID=A0ABQ3VR72_9CHLR|nr:HD domain-containing protein [Dictyobacter formicarum]GHO88194.1 phosphohydrolase [Dictyobacter formicarum]